MSRELTVTGGAHGLAVSLEELEEGARVLEVAGRDVAETAVLVGATAVEPALALAGVIAPVEYVTAEAAVLDCARDAVGVSARVLATAEATRAAVGLYREGEQAAEALFDVAATSVGVTIGASVPTAALAVGLLTPLLLPRLPVLGAPATAALVGLGLGLGQEVDELLVHAPGLVPFVAEGFDGLVIGLGRGTPALGTWLRWRSGRLGVPYPPRTQQEALQVVIAATEGIALDESDQDVRVVPHVVTGVRAPRSVADLVDDSGPTSGGSRVRVVGVPRAEGSWTWVVDVPGTQSFDPRAGENPWDLTSNVLLAAGEQTLTMRAVTRALTDAQRRTGSGGRSRVLLGGRSQGGLTAAALAADPHFRRRFRVTHVVTAGAPVAGLDVPDDVSVLSLEHTEDPVAGLDGADNSDREDWVTVERRVADLLGPDDGATDAHATELYAQTARLVDESDDPSLAAWRAGADAFLDGEGGDPVVIDYAVERVPAGSAAVAGSVP
ncbi:hypothetical protein O9K63_14925 [Janibacter cremeus]|uniref:hypothetical protein n=1 Tax=Janibacter cremeus TaxID=1285192 RepID=UPI0023F6DD05|nr:hypothetical protein [Janibacter cremeus]WEV77867.1 hypothetical protein O9K63_14925 [Janibacter cremeus]